MFLSRSFNSTELQLQQLVTSTPFPQALHLQTVLRWQNLAVSRLPSRSAAKDKREVTAVQHASAALQRLRLTRQRAALLASRALETCACSCPKRIQRKIAHSLHVQQQVARILRVSGAVAAAAWAAAGRPAAPAHTARQRRCGGGGLGGGGPPCGPSGFCGGGRCCSPAGRWMYVCSSSHSFCLGGFRPPIRCVPCARHPSRCADQECSRPDTLLTSTEHVPTGAWASPAPTNLSRTLLTCSQAR